MTKILSYFSPRWAIRLSLGLMYAYSVWDILLFPESRMVFIPTWFLEVIIGVMPVEIYLHIHAFGEGILAFIFLAWFLPRPIVRIAATLAALELFAILTLSGIGHTTFRDIGSIGAALALAFPWPEAVRDLESAAETGVPL